MIDRYRSYEGFSWITIQKVLSYYGINGYKSSGNKPRSFKEIISVLEYMADNKMIEIAQDLDSISYETGIEIKIIPENFDCPDKFCKLYASTFEKIMFSESTINKESVLLAYLYIVSYIGCRKKKEDGSDYYSNSSSSPEAFYKNIDMMAKELSMSKETITKCINCLTDDEILIKKIVGSVKPNNKPPQNVPNIYVINKQGYEKEIEWALQKLKDIYKVEEFNNQTKRIGERNK